jgi:hypothetical protein
MMTDEAAKPPHILSAVHEVMKEAAAVGKDGLNKQQGYPFRSYDGAINVIGPAFRRHGVIPSFKVTSIERRDFRYKESGALMTETLIKLTYKFTSAIDGSVHVVAEDVPGESADSGDKSATKAVTVACRIALLQGLGIPTHQPDPDEETHEREEIPTGPPQASKDEKDEMFNRMKAIADPELRKTVWSQFIANFGDLAVLPAADVDKAWAWIIEHEGPTSADPEPVSDIQDEF